jgi:hypothetical protein
VIIAAARSVAATTSAHSSAPLEINSQLTAPAMTAVKPDQMGADERLTEIAEILALGLIRMRGRMSSPFLPMSGEILLDCNAQQSGPEPNSP